MKLTFVDCACCKLIAGDVGLLFAGSTHPAFNEGSALAKPPPFAPDAIVAGVARFWLSLRMKRRDAARRGA